jgi:putative DNA primase/helicase
MVRHWNELIGYLVQPRRIIPLIVILLGGGDNGKTVLSAPSSGFWATSLCTPSGLEDLDKNRFAMGSLFGKLLFVDDDVRAGARLPDGVLKTISEAKEVTGELKYQPSFNFVVRTVPRSTSAAQPPASFGTEQHCSSSNTMTSKRSFDTSIPQNESIFVSLPC